MNLCRNRLYGGHFLILAAFAAVVTSACANNGSGGLSPAAPNQPSQVAATTHAASRKLKSHATATPTPIPSVDVRPYIATQLGGTFVNPGSMLCRPNANGQATHQCQTSILDGDSTNGEVKYLYTDGNSLQFYDYVGVSSFQHSAVPNASPYYIGVIRNKPSTTEPLRCFSYYVGSDDESCTAPSDAKMIPGGVPIKISDLPVKYWYQVQATANSDGWSPEYPIPGELITTPDSATGNYWSFGTWNMDSNCNQSASGGAYNTKVGIAYVKNVPFGGNIGTRDAIVTDAFDLSGTSAPNLAERAFHVIGLGRVAEGHASSSAGAPYNQSPSYVLWNWEEPMGTWDPMSAFGLTSTNYRSSICPQGSAVSPTA